MGDGGILGEAFAKPLGTAWDDIEELASVLYGGNGHSHADLLLALGQLRRARLARAKTFAGEEASSAQPSGKKAYFRHFEYVPVFRSVSQGQRIHQGIYRVSCRTEMDSGNCIEDGTTDLGRHEALEIERATLEHAIQYLLDRRANGRCMLMVSVHIDTLCKPISQRRFSEVLRSAQLRAKRRLLIEITGYSDVDNTIGTRRAVEELRVHSHAVFIKPSSRMLTGFDKLVAECKRLGIHAFGVDASQYHKLESDGESVLVHVSSLAEQHSIPVYVDGIGSIPILAKAITCGASYICAPALRPALETPENAELVTLDDLYSAI